GSHPPPDPSDAPTWLCRLAPGSFPCPPHQQFLEDCRDRPPRHECCRCQPELPGWSELVRISSNYPRKLRLASTAFMARRSVSTIFKELLVWWTRERSWRAPTKPCRRVAGIGWWV